MKRALLSAEVRAVEALASAEYGMSVAVLMEQAGQALAQAALRLASPEGRFWVVFGPGNNGGDGLVAARKLRQADRVVQVEGVGEATKRSADTVRNLAALETVGLVAGGLASSVDARPGDVVIDAVFGTGLTRAPAGEAARAITRIQEQRTAGAKVLAADLPSGLPSDGAPPPGSVVEADVTVSFGVLKVGQVTPEGARVCSRIDVAPIGLPPEKDWRLSGPGVFLLEEEDARGAIPVRSLDSHKGNFGHVLVVAGSIGKTGAATLCARAVMRSGAGLCTLAARSPALELSMAGVAEAMGATLSAEGELGRADAPALGALLDKKAAWVVGPGIPRGPQTLELLATLLAEHAVPCVLDADALNAFAGSLERLRNAKGPLVLTPHPGEAARLLQTDIASVQADRFGSARALAERCRATVVLKGARTIIATPDGRLCVNPTGNPGMATGGTGDVLAGMCGALLAQGIAAPAAACAAVYVHGLAGDLAAQRCGQAGLMASDIVEALGTVWAQWKR